MARIYLSGPMTGIPDYNFPAFNAVAAAWRAAGWDVTNPAESFDGAQDRSYRDYAAKDIQDLQACDAIAMLPGWDGPNARGSVWEREVAMTLLKLPVFDAEYPRSPLEPFIAQILRGPNTLHNTRFDGAICQNKRIRSEVLPSDPAARKAVPLVSGVLDYFPAALAEIAAVSKAGNDQHNPGQPMHWARGKSMDQADCIMRHLVERGSLDSDGVRHSAKVAWRALALLQLELEDAGAPLARGAKLATPEP